MEKDFPGFHNTVKKPDGMILMPRMVMVGVGTGYMNRGGAEKEGVGSLALNQFGIIFGERLERHLHG